MPSAIILVICTAESTFIRSLAVCHQRSLPGMTAPKAVILLRKLLASVPPVVPCGYVTSRRESGSANAAGSCSTVAR